MRGVSLFRRIPQPPRAAINQCETYPPYEYYIHRSTTTRPTSCPLHQLAGAEETVLPVRADEGLVVALVRVQLSGTRTLGRFRTGLSQLAEAMSPAE